MTDKTPTIEPRSTRQIIPQPAQARRETETRQPVGTDPQASPTRALQSPELASAEDIVSLQRLAGNQAVTRLIQTKLVVGAADDPYEREADRVADQVLSMPDAALKPHATTSPASPGAQRLAEGITPLQRSVQRAPEEEEEVQTARLQRAPEEEEEELQASRLQRAPEEEEEVQTSRLQRAPEEEEEEIQPARLQRTSEDEEEPVQGKRLQRAPEEEEEIQTSRKFDPRGSFTASTGVESALHAQQGSGSPLPGELRAFMEPRFGVDFSGVRLHTGSEAAVLNRSLHAQAFTHGQDIFLGEGRFDPGSPSGKHLLAHELTHVVQQNGGRLSRLVQPTQQAPLLRRSVIQRENTGLGAWSRPLAIRPQTPEEQAAQSQQNALQNQQRLLQQQAAQFEGTVNAIVDWVEKIVNTQDGAVADGSHSRVNYYPNKKFRTNQLDAAVERWRYRGAGYHGFKVQFKDGIRQAHFLKPQPGRNNYRANVHVKPLD